MFYLFCCGFLDGALFMLLMSRRTISRPLTPHRMFHVLSSATTLWRVGWFHAQRIPVRGKHLDQFTLVRRRNMALTNSVYLFTLSPTRRRSHAFRKIMHLLDWINSPPDHLWSSFFGMPTMNQTSCGNGTNFMWYVNNISFVTSLFMTSRQLILEWLQTTVLLPLPVIFIVYDFFYTILHWALHIKSIYGFIHKHHHVQKAPRWVRWNVDLP